MEGLTRQHEQSRHKFLFLVVCVVTSVLGTNMLAGIDAIAHDGGNTPALGIVGDSDIFVPEGPYDDSFNGVKVYLSSPRHGDSGAKGECMDPGRQENVNGRYWNFNAANGSYYGGTVTTTNPNRNLHSRGYKVMVSQNTKDDDHLANRNESANWGSDLHIVTHTNGTQGCHSPGDYLLTIWQHDAGDKDDKSLALALGQELNPHWPGPYNNWQDSFSELYRNAPKGDAYVELQFHDNRDTQQFIYHHSDDRAYHYGLAIDAYLGYP